MACLRRRLWALEKKWPREKRPHSWAKTGKVPETRPHALDSGALLHKTEADSAEKVHLSEQPVREPQSVLQSQLGKKRRAQPVWAMGYGEDPSPEGQHSHP